MHSAVNKTISRVCFLFRADVYRRIYWFAVVLSGSEWSLKVPLPTLQTRSFVSRLCQRLNTRFRAAEWFTNTLGAWVNLARSTVRARFLQTTGKALPETGHLYPLKWHNCLHLVGQLRKKSTLFTAQQFSIHSFKCLFYRKNIVQSKSLSWTSPCLKPELYFLKCILKKKPTCRLTLTRINYQLAEQINEQFLFA